MSPTLDDVFLPIGPLEDFLGVYRHGGTSSDRQAARSVEQRYNAKDFAEVAGCSLRTVVRWRTSRAIPLRWADRVAVALGVHPLAIWPDDYAAWLSGELAQRSCIMSG